MIPHFEAVEVYFVAEEGLSGAVDDGGVQGQVLCLVIFNRLKKALFKQLHVNLPAT